MKKNTLFAQRTSYWLMTHLLRASALVALVVMLSLAIIGLPRTNALPGAAYRYSASMCGGSDATCYKYSAEAGVYRSYRGVLNRQPEASGLYYWAARLQNGSSTLTGLASALLGSSEWRGKYSSIDNNQFVAQTYQFLLHRNPDASGNSYWVNQLNSGSQSRAQMVASMVNSSEAINVQHGAFMNYYRPAARPPSQPQPSQPSSPGRRPSSSSGSGSTTASGLGISNLTITEQTYRSALVSYTTNRATSSKIDFGTDKDDLSTEIFDAAAVTNHQVRFEHESIRAGKHYYLRLSADDGSGLVTIDTELETKPIPVVITVKDDADKPLNEANLSVNEQTGVTDENGEWQVSLPEGEVTIFAEKDDLSRELQTTIEIPEGDEPQRVEIALSEDTSVPATNTQSATLQKKSSGVLRTILLALLLIGLLVLGWFLWRRRRAQQSTSPAYVGDALEAENYTADVLPSTPQPEKTKDKVDDELPAPPPLPEITPVDPNYQPLHDPTIEHHATLPELVGRYGTAEATEDHGKKAHGDGQLSPTGQKIPKHTSLKEMVNVPNDEAAKETESPVNDLPASPVDEPKHSKHAKDHGKSADLKADKHDDDGSPLVIQH